MEDPRPSQPISSTNPALSDPDKIQKFHQWVHCICLVEFDIEEGQVITYEYPKNTLKDTENRIVADLALQDSHGNKAGQVMSKHVFVVGEDLSNRFFAFSCQIRIPNKNIKRGYEQKAVVVVCKYPLVELFFYMLNIVGPRIVSHGVGAAEDAIEQICSWPKPNWGSVLSLQIMGCVFRLNLPKPIPPNGNLTAEMKLYRILEAQNFKNTEAIISEAIGNTELYNKHMNNYRLPLFNYPDLGGNMDKFLATNGIGIIRSDSNLALIITPSLMGNIWHIFIHMIIGNPIIVFGSNAQSISGVVMALISLLGILPFGTQLIPYFSTYHKMCDEFFPSPTEPPKLPPCIIGMTNPYFEPSIKLLTRGVIIWIDRREIEVRQPKKKQNPIVSLIKDIKHKASSKSTTIDSIYDHFQPDKHVLKSVQNQNWQVACAIIKGHFQSIIDELLGPLNIWFKIPQFIGYSQCPKDDDQTLGAFTTQLSGGSPSGYSSPRNINPLAVKSFNSFNGVPIGVAIDKVLEMDLNLSYAPPSDPPIGPLNKTNAMIAAKKHYDINPPKTLINIMGNNKDRIIELFEVFVNSVHFKYLMLLQMPMMLIAKRELFDYTICRVITTDTLICGRSKNSLKMLEERLISFQKKIEAHVSTTDRVKAHLAQVVREINELLDDK